MDQIYFSNSENTSKLRRVAKAAVLGTTASMSTLLPGITFKVAEKVLCTPSRPAKGKKNLHESFQRGSLVAEGIEIATYHKGNFERSIVFCHGWSGSAFDFTPFYDSVLAAGFNVVTFDHVAHGNSQGKHANLFLFIAGLESVLKSLEGKTTLAGIVGHSMGGSAVISAAPNAEPVPLALVAPVVPLFETLYTSVDNFGISHNWVKLLVRNLEKRFGRSVEAIDPKLQIKKVKNPLLIFHDRKDSYISLELNKSYFSDHAAKALVETEQLGHFRILKAPHVVKKVIEFFHHDPN